MTEEEHQHIFERWLSQYRALMFKVVRAYAFTPTDQDDLFQEISFTTVALNCLIPECFCSEHMDIPHCFKHFY